MQSYKFKQEIRNLKKDTDYKEIVEKEFLKAYNKAIDDVLEIIRFYESKFIIETKTFVFDIDINKFFKENKNIELIDIKFSNHVALIIYKKYK